MVNGNGYDDCDDEDGDDGEDDDDYHHTMMLTYTRPRRYPTI